MATEVLGTAEIDAALAGLPGVHRGPAGRLRLRVKAPSFPAAVELIGRAATTAEEMDHHPDVDLRWRTVTFGLATHSAGGVTTLDLELAGQLLGHATDLGAEVLGPPSRVEIALDAADPEALRPFWRVGLGYTEQAGPRGGVELQHPEGAGPVLWFQTMDPPRAGRGRIHLDVYVSPEDAPGRVADTIAAGGRLVSDEFAPDWWVLADAEGNELCVCVTEAG